ncbi:MAG: alpha/beta fold hydrolase [Actinomycetota bacterium]|nr:alpha/beta fold hydrolase [Actinomycetota bacterium]
MKTLTDITYIEGPPRQTVEGTPPLLIMLHGVGSNERDLIELAPALDPRFHIVSLRAPITLAPGSYAWFNVLFTPEGPLHNAKEADTSREILVDTIPGLVAATETDPDRVYLLGFSQGAIMSLALALTVPTVVAGVVAMSARTLPEIRDHLGLPTDLAHLSLLVVHGTEDVTLPVRYGRETRDFLETLPVNLTYREYPMGHHVSPESLADVAAWLTQQLDSPLAGMDAT